MTFPSVGSLLDNKNSYSYSYIVFDKMSDGRYITFSVCKCRKHNMVDRDRNKDAT